MEYCWNGVGSAGADAVEEEEVVCVLNVYTRTRVGDEVEEEEVVCVLNVCTCTCTRMGGYILF